MARAAGSIAPGGPRTGPAIRGLIHPATSDRVAMGTAYTMGTAYKRSSAGLAAGAWIFEVFAESQLHSVETLQVEYAAIFDSALVCGFVLARRSVLDRFCALVDARRAPLARERRATACDDSESSLDGCGEQRVMCSGPDPRRPRSRLEIV